MNIQFCFHSIFHIVMYVSERGVSVAVFDNVVHMHICLHNRWRKCLSNIKNFMLKHWFNTSKYMKAE